MKTSRESPTQQISKSRSAVILETTKGPFVVIGNRGTSIPKSLTHLESPLVIGKNAPLPKTRQKPGGPEPLWIKSHAWISKRPLPFELFPVREAVAKGLVNPARVEWVSRAGKRFKGTAYFPKSSSLRNQPRVLAVEAPNWPHGRVESEMVNDGRNENVVGRITSVEAMDDESISVVDSPSPVAMPTEDLAGPGEYFEGDKKLQLGSRYERDPKAREACIQAHGTRCVVCNFDFEEKYGILGQGFTNVHHLQQLADGAAPRKIDPVNDMRPVCANCHAIIHRRKNMLTTEELKIIVERNS